MLDEPSLATLRGKCRMGKIKAQIKTSFGEIVVEGETAEDVLKILRGLPEEFVGEIETLVSRKISFSRRVSLVGVIEYTEDGPIITSGAISRAKLTHYEAIGLILYASEMRVNTSSRIRRLLEHSGIKSQVSSRLNEMAKRGLVYKPNLSKSNWKLTAEGERWIREKVLSKLTRS